MHTTENWVETEDKQEFVGRRSDEQEKGKRSQRHEG
eukprot:CAMPEP_0174261318 /NCGR_PEP_ID=MMETSP0439-20130205/11362_1 /TAXON_ID=0 /ORGANISM="Stereomyxa ramosa, Strain Chinc5" /LENGTH=35 /DNA_ID= /DNA_START= /DNA_END= /DNA_ORIENTATION=